MRRRLQAVLAKVPRRAAVVLTTKTWRPWKANHFRHQFRKALTSGGLDDYTFHGPRKTTAGGLAEAGSTHEEIKAITGHKTDAMLGRYVAARDGKPGLTLPFAS